jgi:hypothetical protein
MIFIPDSFEFRGILLRFVSSESNNVHLSTKIYCGVEQLVARRAHNPEVIGSSPVPATRNPCKSNSYRGFYLNTNSQSDKNITKERLSLQQILTSLFGNAHEMPHIQ